jgi:hypothetical protein
LLLTTALLTQSVIIPTMRVKLGLIVTKPTFSNVCSSHVCKHKYFLAKMFYQNIGPSSMHVFHMYWVYFSSKKPVIF